jgi:tetratricopeptide (TPR) repeat protein
MSNRRRASTRHVPRATVGRSEGAAKHNYAPWAALGLVGLTLAVYASVWHAEFVRFDDPDYVTQNPQVTAGLTWDGIKWALTTGHAANWHPLTWLSHMLDVQVFGMSAGPHHLTNLAFHVINTLLLFTALRRMTGAVGRSAFAAALFAVHPLHVESVAWVSERKDVLSAFFWMLTLLAYIEYVRHSGVRRYLLVALMIAFGLLAKPMVVTLPFVLLLLDVWPFQRITLWRDGRWLIGAGDRSTAIRLVREKIPLFALAAASSVVTVNVQRRGGAVGNLAVYPLVLRVENAIISYVAYIAKMVWPMRLSAFYPYRQSPSILATGAAALLLIAAAVAVVRVARRRPYLLVGWFWYLSTLIPVIGIVQVGLQSMADRYTYIPLVGLFIIVAWGATDVIARWPRQHAVLPVVAALVLAICALTARSQVQTWRNSLALWQHAVDVTSDNAYAQYNLGVVLLEAGRPDEGMARLREALRIDPDYADVHIDLGNAFNSRGALDSALAEFATVVRLRPDYAEARVKYGNLLRSNGRNADATAQYREAVRLEPGLATAHNELGNALTSDGSYDDAMAEYVQAVRLAPGFAEAHNNVGAAFARAGKSEEAINEFLEALRLKPGDATFHYNAALMLERVGRSKEAIEHLQAALRTDPQNDAVKRALDRLAPGRGG